MVIFVLRSRRGQIRSTAFLRVFRDWYKDSRDSKFEYLYWILFHRGTRDVVRAGTPFNNQR